MAVMAVMGRFCMQSVLCKRSACAEIMESLAESAFSGLFKREICAKSGGSYLHNDVFLQSCAAEKSVACPADFLDIADILVDVAVHGHRNFGMSGNALQGFDVYATCGLQLGQEGVAKHMRGHTLGKVDFLADSLPCVSEGTFA